MRILGIDPGLQNTGWGIVEKHGSKLVFVESGLIKTQTKLPLYSRLGSIAHKLEDVIQRYKPDLASVEETFMNKNPASALKLGQARGVAIVTPARMGLEVFEYSANAVKKTVVGAGHANKDQVAMMVRTLLPKSGKVSADEADALAIAICHAHHADYNRKMEALNSAQ